MHHLAHATRHASVLLAGTFRDRQIGEENPDLAGALQTLSRERLAERLPVRRLSLEETTQFVAATMGGSGVSEEFAAFVYRRTKGIPRLIDQLVRSLGGRLELRGEIGAGAMGRVFRAFDHTRGTTVAAKLVLARREIDLDTVLRFQQEAAVLAKLDHPHIVAIHDTFVEEHASCIIMELLEGPSLAEILRGGPLPLSRARRLALQVVEALAYAHSQGIVHRDIKPDNVMILPADQVKVTDFGIARLLQPDTSLATIATTGLRMGTPLYMAPEQIAGKTIDGRADLYALGALLYHMVTGQPPFAGSDALAIAVQHLQEDPVPPSTLNPAVPADWDALMLWALAKDPIRRVPSARDMARELRALSDGPRAVVPPTMRSRRSARGARLTGVLLAGAALAAVGLVGGRLLPAAAPTLVRVDPTTAIRTTLRTPQRGGFTHFAFTPGALWVTSPINGTVIRFDTGTNRAVAVIKVGDPARDPDQTDPFDVAAVGNELWAIDRADRAVVRIDPATNKVVATVPIGIRSTSLAVAGQTVWAAADGSSPPGTANNVVEVNLHTRKVAGVLHTVSPLGSQIAATTKALWVITPAGKAEIERLDPGTRKVVAVIDVGLQPESLAAGAGAVWVLNQPGTVLSHIDPRTNRVVATIDLSAYPGQKEGCMCHNVAIGYGAVWVIARNRTLVRIDPSSNRITAVLTLGRDGYDVAVGQGSVWVGDDDAARHLVIDRIDPGAMK